MVPPSNSGPNKVPFPCAFNRVKKFLKGLLRSLSNAEDEFVRKMGSMVALKELVTN